MPEAHCRYTALPVGTAGLTGVHAAEQIAFDHRLPVPGKTGVPPQRLSRSALWTQRVYATKMLGRGQNAWSPRRQATSVGQSSSHSNALVVRLACRASKAAPSRIRMEQSAVPP